MKAQEILKVIKSIEEERALKLLEDIFMSGYIKGIAKGYDNIHRIKQKFPLVSDSSSAIKAFEEKYL